MITVSEPFDFDDPYVQPIDMLMNDADILPNTICNRLGVQSFTYLYNGKSLSSKASHYLLMEICPPWSKWLDLRVLKSWANQVFFLISKNLSAVLDGVILQEVNFFQIVYNGFKFQFIHMKSVMKYFQILSLVVWFVLVVQEQPHAW